MKLEKQIQNYCLTGFPEDPVKLKFYKQSLQPYGAKFIQKLSQQTNILVVNQTLHQKFKIAQLNKNPIPCVNKKWIQDSHKKKCLQPINKYLITEKEMFLNATIAVCGFSPEHTVKIQKIIKERNGKIVTKYKASQIIKKYNQIQDYIDVIVASSEEIERAKLARLPTQSQYIPPLVGIEWLEDSLKKKRCKYPHDYALNLLITKPLVSCYNKLFAKLQTFIAVNDIMDKSSDFLSDVVVFIDSDINSDMIRLFRNLIAVCGGYWVEKFSSVITHVIVADIDEAKYQRYKKYGSKINIIRAEWLVDSICLYKHLEEEDYFIRSFKINQKQIKTIYDQFLRNSHNSINFNGNNNNSISIPFNNNITSIQPLKKSKSSSEPKSTIFKNINFYIDKQLVSEPFYQQLNKTIKNAGGNTYYIINDRMSVYVPLKDSPNNLSIVKSLTMKKYKFRVVSDRWVKYCIKKNQYIKPELDYYLQFRALNFNVPLPEFHKFVFDIVGFDKLQGLRIKEILPILGSTKTNPNKCQITHVLCGSQYKDKESKDKLKKTFVVNQRIQLIRSQWLFECLNHGRVVDLEKFCFDENEIIDLVMPQSEENQQIQDKNNNSGKTGTALTP